ncbi:MAG: RNA polymerase sigma factor [Ardenticatenaceae bacterium]|nr:RNA polymerase sigma factor [Ardenticatenaceae bacterium]
MSGYSDETIKILLDPTISNTSLTEILVARYYAYIVRLAVSIVRTPAEAEDVAQDTFISALTRIDQLDPESNVRAWLSTIAVNKCRDLLRRRQRRQLFQSGIQMVQSFVERQPAPEEAAVQQETSVHLWAAVDQLKEKHRLPIILRYVHNLSIPEIATILETKEGTIYSRLHYACRQLGHQLELSLAGYTVPEGVVR